MKSPVWTTALPDWERRIVARESLLPCAPLFPQQAKDGLEYFDALRAVDVGPDMPTMGEICRPWVRDWVASILGAFDGYEQRLIKEWFLLISKKNGKSTTAGLLMLTVLLLNFRPSAEFGILAPTVEVANNAFKPAADAIRADEELKAMMHVQDHIRTITHLGTRATLQVVAADSDTVAGKKWVGTFIDELWLFGKRANAFKMLEEATGGMASRKEGFVIYASTQSDEEPAGVFKDKLAYARKVRDGEIEDPQFLPVLYEFPKAMVESQAYLDEENFYITNPNMGASVDEAFIRRKMRMVGEAGEESIQVVLAKYLNVQIGQNLSGNRWTGADFWKASADKSLTLDTLLARCDVVVVGLDGGGHDDLYGFTVLGRDDKTGHLLSWSRAWALPIVLERRKEIAPRLLDFKKAGELVIVQRIEEACDEVVALIQKVEQAGKLGALDEGKRKAIGVDPAGIKQTLDALNAADYPAEQICAVSQGWRLGSAIKSTELYLSSGTLLHADQELMAWCVGNAKVEPKGNAVLITKQISGSAKIDPLMSLFNCVELMSRSPEPSRKEFQLFFA